jgi:hypothetical protein
MPTTRPPLAPRSRSSPADSGKSGRVPGASGYLGQGPGNILAGLGDWDQPVIVRLLWPTGVPQDELNIAAKGEADVKELDRRGSSCPVVFAWNGEQV